MKVILRLFIFIVSALLIIFSSNADELTDDKKFIISYVEHDSIISYYVPLLKAAYKKIGISPEFIMVNDQRALKLLNKGLIDAETAKTDEALKDHTNILKIPTPISKIEIMLICQVELTCNLKALENPRKVLGVIGAMMFYQKLLLIADIKIVELSSFATLTQMFNQNKLDYMIMVFDSKDIPAKNSFNNKYLIGTKLGYHLLHKKHKNLLPKIEQAIKQVIKENAITKEF